MTAAAIRTWSRDGQILAVGLVDTPGLLRLAITPEAERDAELAQQMVTDVAEPERGVLPLGKASIELRFGAVLQRLLLNGGWEPAAPVDTAAV